MQPQSDLYILFHNISQLLRRDLTKEKMYRVEETDYRKLIGFLDDAVEDIESLQSRGQLQSSNLSAAYAIPYLFQAYDERKSDFAGLFASTPDQKEFFKLIRDKIRVYYDTKTMDSSLREKLADFFDALSQYYDSTHQFEKVELITEEVN